MKIIIEDGLNLYKKTGQGQYSINIHNILVQLGYEVEMKRKPFLEKIKNSTIKRILYVIWINTIFPIKMLFNKSSIIIYTNTITPLFRLPHKKYYPVLHDLWAYKSPDTVTKAQKIYTDVVLFSIKNTYEKIITVSETSKSEIIDFFKCNDKDVQVIYNFFSFNGTYNNEYDESTEQILLKKLGIDRKKYILSVGTHNKRKNLQSLVDAFNLDNLDLKLVLPGAKHSQIFENLNKNIIFPGYVNEEELKILYKNALIYVFPSVYEGFGIPIIDAQNFGVPLICSDIEVFHEVAGEAALFCIPNADDIAKKIKILSENENMRNKLIEKGYENIKRFSLERIKLQIKLFIEEQNEIGEV